MASAKTLYHNARRALRKLLDWKPDDPVAEAEELEATADVERALAELAYMEACERSYTAAVDAARLAVQEEFAGELEPFDKRRDELDEWLKEYHQRDGFEFPNGKKSSNYAGGTCGFALRGGKAAKVDFAKSALESSDKLVADHQLQGDVESIMAVLGELAAVCNVRIDVDLKAAKALHEAGKLTAEQLGQLGVRYAEAMPKEDRFEVKPTEYSMAER